MMTAKALLTLVNNKKFLYSAIAVFFLPFIIFSFWNFPSADDYMIIVKKSQFSFWELQSSVYHNWTGRYFATFISSIFSYSGFLYSHYYLHSLLLLSLTVLSWFFCLIQVNKFFLDRCLSLSALIALSLLLLILEINIIPEPVTAFYWFSSAVTYQLPLIILIFLTGTIIRLLHTSTNKILHLITASLLLIMLNGCNEMITLFVIVFFTSLIGYYLFANKKIPFPVICLYILVIITAGFLIFSPGILNRQSKLGDGSFASAIGITFIKFIVLHWYFLKEPMWWFSVFSVTLYFSKNKHLYQGFKNAKRVHFTSVIFIYAISGALIYLPVLYTTNGSLPLRAENIICFLYSLIFLLILSIYISKKVNSITFQFFQKYNYFLFSILIFSSGNMKNVTDSLLSGYFYNHVMKNRLSLFEYAKQHNEHEITFDDYQTAVSKKIQQNPRLDRQVIKEIIQRPPPIICFGSDVYDLNYIKEFYGIKKINIIKN